MFNNQIIAGSSGAAGGGFYPYSIDQSLRFDAVGYLTRNTGAAGNTTIYTTSVWVKRSNISSNQYIFSAGPWNSGDDFEGIRFTDGDALRAVLTVNNSTVASFLTNAVFRDVGAWYHIVWQRNGQAYKIYVNGTEQTYSSSTFSSNPAGYLTANTEQLISGRLDHLQDFDGYLAEFNFVDGTALDATSFGETINGVWVPKAYSGSYGTNGFYLSFADSAAIGDDLSGNTNDFTASNLAASDVVPDSPTNNFATLNSAANFTPATLAEGNLKATPTNSSDKRHHSTFPISSGKWYCEIRIVSTGSRNQLGFWSIENTASSSLPTNYARLGVGNSSSGTSGTFNGTAFTASAGDILTYAFDADDGKLYFGRNAAPTIGATADFTGLASDTYVLGQREPGTLNTTNHFNFGQDDTFAGAITAGGNSDDNGIGTFKYAPPSGFLAMCSANLPEPTISPNAAEQADDYFTTVLSTGDGTNATISGFGFQPDFLWHKARSVANGHWVMDSIRVDGSGDSFPVRVDSSNAEGSSVSVTLNSDGYVHLNGSSNNFYGSGQTYVDWAWKAGGTAVSNTDGSITSQVSAAPDAGFSIVTYTGAGTGTVGHGLGITPSMYIVKCRSNAATSWRVYHKGIASDAETDYLTLDSSGAAADVNFWNDTAPTDSVFSVFNYDDTGTSGRTYVAYVFADVDGFSKAGSYIGNANADGTFVYTGFRPAWVMLKNASASGAWYIFDVKRNTYNAMDNYLRPNLSNAEGNLDFCDFTSNGFKIRSSAAEWNGSGNTIIVLSFAEAPFKYANAR